MVDLHECIEKLSSEHEADRIYAAEDIGYANEASGARALLARLPEEPSRAVREAIFGALLQIEDESVISGALALLDSEDSFLRNQALEVLRARGGKTLPHLERAFAEGNNDRRKFVVDIAAKLGDPGTSVIYERALKDPDLNVVITAVESIGNARQVQFRVHLERLLSPDGHPMLLGACLEALAQIGEPASVETVRGRLGHLGSVPGYLQPSYLRLLGACGCPADVDEVASMIGSEGVGTAALNTLTSLRNRYPDLTLPERLAGPLQDVVAQSPSALLGYEAVRLLGGLLRDRAVLDFLEACLEHTEKAVRIGAVQALREGGNGQTEAVLRQRLAHETDEEVLQAWGGKITE